MLEIPEAYVMAKQLNETAAGLRIKRVEVASAPHKFAFYYEDPQAYNDLLSGESIDKASPVGGMVEIRAGDKILLLNDGVFVFMDQEQLLPKNTNC